MVTIKDIAKKMGVSVSTVSRALNNHPDIRKETKEEVLKTMNALNYTPNAMARSLIHKKSNMIGLMVPDITDPFFSEITLEVEEILSKKGYQIVYCNSNGSQEKEKRFLSNVLEHKMDGVIVTPDYINTELIDRLIANRIPIVYLRRRPPFDKNIPFIDVDHYKGACEAISYLLSLNHQKIGFIGMPEYSQTGRERFRGYEDIMYQNGLSPRTVISNNRTIESGFQAMEELMNIDPKCSAIFAANDQLAIGILEWLAKNNIKVPDDISVMGFDNIEMTQLHWIKLTTVSQPKREMGKKAAEILLKLINETPLKTLSTILDTQLVVRNTCRENKTKL